MDKFYRIFAAIDFSQRDKETLYQFAMKVKENSVKGNFTQKDNLHLTLAFIGETRKIKEAEKALQIGVKNSLVPPFTIETKKLGRFQNKGGDILWVGLTESPELIKLNEEITKSLRAEGFFIEEQKFKAHLTIGRGVVLQKEVTPEVLSSYLPKLSLPVNSVHLMKSERIAGKLKYSSLWEENLS